ncbi:MAG TPA: GNAT family N-acetyltransferase [Candidatus Saccharimonadales bacterium]
MKLILKIPDESDRERVLDFRQEFLDSYHEHHIPGARALAVSDTYEQWLEHIARVQTQPEEGEVNATQYIAIDEESGKVVGVIQLRHRLNDHLLNVGGHIGYSIRPSERRKGYGKKMLELALEHARTLGIHDILLTCDASNVASASVIERNDGKLENILETPEGLLKRRFWIKLR